MFSQKMTRVKRALISVMPEPYKLEQQTPVLSYKLNSVMPLQSNDFLNALADMLGTIVGIA